MGYDTIHETAISDITAILKDGINVAKDAFSRTSDLRYSSSIAKSAKGLIMEFPVLVSKANHIESAATVAKAYEAKFVTMLQLVFAASNITHAKDGYEYVKKFHTNLDDKSMYDLKGVSVDDFINIMDGFVKEGANISADSYALYKAVTEDMKNLNFYFEEDINESSLNNYKVLKNYNDIKVVKEAVPFEDKDKKVDDVTDAEAQASKELENEERKKKQEEKDARDTEKLQLDKNKDVRDAIKFSLDINKDTYNMAKTQAELIRNYLVPSEIKKANELVPTMMLVNFVKEGPNGNTYSQMIVGVKAKLYEVEPVDVINKIITKHVDNNLLLKLVKVSTREISFVKDFLLAIDDAKLSALSKSKKGSTNKLFKVLERRALGGKIRKLLKRDNYTMAISSLVISQEEVEELLKNNIDVTNPSVIRPIMEKLNLISFAIIDESSEAVRFIFDTGDDTYETIPLSKLEREQKDGMSKKVINLLAKMNR